MPEIIMVDLNEDMKASDLCFGDYESLSLTFKVWRCIAKTWLNYTINIRLS